MTTPKKCGIKRIDDLIDGVAGAKPIEENDTDKDAVSAVQDLLVGFNLFPSLLGLRGTQRGKFGSPMKDYVKTRRKKWGIEPKDKVIVDQAFIRKLLDMSQPESATERNPISSRIYLTRMLGFDFTPFLRCVWLTSMHETDGRFMRASDRTLNKRDKAGLSYGIIQWTHISGRLHIIMQRLKAKNAVLLRQCFGGEANVQKMLEHAGKGKDALKEDGTSNVQGIEFLDDEWRSKFIAAGGKKVFQEEQVKQALEDFRGYYDAFQKLQKDKPPLIESERGIALMLDLINQFGFAGARDKVYLPAHAKSDTPAKLLQEIHAQTPGVKNKERRKFFLETEQLSDGPFVP